VGSGAARQFISVGGGPAYLGYMNAETRGPQGCGSDGEGAPLVSAEADDAKGFRIARTEGALFALHPNATHFGTRTCTVRTSWCRASGASCGASTTAARGSCCPTTASRCCSYGYAENLAHAVLLAVGAPGAAGQIYNCADEETLTLRQVVEIVRDALGAALEIVSLPGALAVPARPLLMQPWTTHRVFDLAKLRTELGYRDVVPAREALAQTARWPTPTRSSAAARRRRSCRTRSITPPRTAGRRLAPRSPRAGRRVEARAGLHRVVQRPRRHAALGRVRVSRRALAGALLALTGCAWFPPLPTPHLTADWATHRMASDELREASGLALSHRQPNLLWTHNDSGDRARLFLLDLEGALVAEYAVDGAKAIDWEDMTADGAGHLYVGDIGNNRSARRDLRVYRLVEPDPSEPSRACAERSMPFHYADQSAFDPSAFDAEALYFADGALRS
jgi:uncharacterized protein YbjT (DUF2867 family)